MLATHTLSLSLHPSSTPVARPYSLSVHRLAFADSTNVNSCSSLYGPAYSKSVVYPTSSVRTGSNWSDSESPNGIISASCHSRQRHSLTSSLFPVSHKAPPTVSVSLSAASSQRERYCSSKVQGLEPDFPDVTSLVPFPSSPSDSNTDVDMLDGTCVPCPDGHLPSAGQAPRKRRSAHSSVSSLRSSPVKDVKPKRPRKSKQQVAELLWLGVVHRSILRGIEARRSAGELDASDRLHSGLCDFDAMDRTLVEKIERRLADNGCGEGRALPNPLPRTSSPSISAPSLILLTPSRRTVSFESTLFISSSGLNPKGSILLDGTATSPPAFKAPPSASLSITSDPTISAPPSMSDRRHVRFEIPQPPRQSQPHPSIPRRSPSPPVRSGTTSVNAHTLTLTMPQLVASLTLAYHERSRLRLRGRTPRVTECGKSASRAVSSVSWRGVRRNDGDMIHKEKVHQSPAPRVRLSSAPERKSPLSRVAYVES